MLVAKILKKIQGKNFFFDNCEIELTIAIFTLFLS